MKSLEYLNQSPPVLRTNFNRDSSAIKSRGGYVIHSGVHRSTAFVSDSEAVASLEFWRDAVALNSWIESTIEGCDLETCELNALAKLFPAWKFVKVNSCGNVIFSGVRQDGKFEIRIAGRDWQEIEIKVKL